MLISSGGGGGGRDYCTVGAYLYPLIFIHYVHHFIFGLDMFFVSLFLTHKKFEKLCICGS